MGSWIWSGQKISFPLRAQNCAFRHELVLSHGEIAFLSLESSSLKELKANGTQFKGSVLLSGINAFGPVNLENSAIDGDLTCTNGILSAKMKGRLSTRMAQRFRDVSCWTAGSNLKDKYV
jgi:hypothetical protein